MKIYDLLKWFAEPVVKIALSLTGVLGIIIGAIANPQGAVNGFVCRIIDLVASVWPSTPDQFKILPLVHSFITNDSQTIGGAVVQEIYSLAGVMLLIVLSVKVYKLIPFKAT